MLVRQSRRRGATLIEGAMVLPILVTLILGMLIGGIGIFSNSQVAMLAREGARYAAVHGPTYANETGNAQATADTVKTKAVLPIAAGLNSSGISVSLTWNGSTANPASMTVDVTVSYQWSPLTVFPAMTLSSTSELPVTY